MIILFGVKTAESWKKKPKTFNAYHPEILFVQFLINLFYVSLIIFGDMIIIACTKFRKNSEEMWIVNEMKLKC